MFWFSECVYLCIHSYYVWWFNETQERGTGGEPAPDCPNVAEDARTRACCWVYASAVNINAPDTVDSARTVRRVKRVLPRWVCGFCRFLYSCQVGAPYSHGCESGASWVTPLARSRLARNLSVSRLSFVSLSLSLSIDDTRACLFLSRVLRSVSFLFSLTHSLSLFHRLPYLFLSVFSSSVYFYTALGISAWFSPLFLVARYTLDNCLLEDDNGNTVTFVATLTFLLSIGRVACAPPVACCVTAFYDSSPLRLSRVHRLPPSPSLFPASRKSLMLQSFSDLTFWTAQLHWWVLFVFFSFYWHTANFSSSLHMLFSFPVQ